MSRVRKALYALSGLLLFPVILFAHETAALASVATPLQLFQQLTSLTNIIQNHSSSATPSTAATTGSVPAVSQNAVDDELLASAKKRFQLMKNLAKKNPFEFLLLVFPPEILAQLPISVLQLTEQKAVITGVTNVLHNDDFSNVHNSEFQYSINSSGKKYDLYFAGDAPPIISGSLLQVDGYKLDTIFVANAGSASTQVLSAPAPQATGSQNVLAILITGPGQPATPSMAQMKLTMFSSNFGKYYDEQSYGKVHFTGDVTDWISVPTTPYPTSVCGAFDTNTSAISSYLINNGIDLSKYSRLVFVINNTAGGCSYVGKTTVGFNTKTFNVSESWVGWPDSAWARSGMTGFEYVLSHEMGHALGVMHANAWNCSTTSIDTGCEHQEYGNTYDVMGQGVDATHFNAFYKDFLGWIATSSKVNVTKTTTVKLSPLETAIGTKTAIVKNPGLTTVPPLYIEYRKPIGFDAVLPSASVGLFLNQVISGSYQNTVGSQWSNPFSRLLNGNYAAGPGLQPALLPGNTFAYARHGITVGSVSIASSTATFSVGVQTPVCQRIGLQADITDTRDIVGAGSSGWLNFNLNNNDYSACAPSTITVSAFLDDPKPWAVSVNPNTSFTLSPDTAQYVSVAFTSPKNSTFGHHTLTITLTDTTNGRTVTVTRPVTVDVAPKISSLSPPSGRPGIPVKIYGSNFAESPETNSVAIAGNGYSAWIPSLTALNGALSITFPTTMDIGNGAGTEEVPIPTPLGTYVVTVVRDGDGGTSNPLTFIASTSSAPFCHVSTNASTTQTKVPFTVSWTSTNATSMTGLIKDTIFPANGNQSMQIDFVGTTTYKLAFSGKGGVRSCTLKVFTAATGTSVTRDTLRKSDLAAIKSALEKYKTAHGTYQVSGAGNAGSGSGWVSYEVASSTSYPKAITRVLYEAGYLKTPIIDDPLKHPSYMLYLCNSYNTYSLAATLENPSTKDLATIQNTCRTDATITKYGKNYAATGGIPMATTTAALSNPLGSVASVFVAIGSSFVSLMTGK